MKGIDSEHGCHANFSDTGERTFPVRWIRADSLDPLGLMPKASKKISLAVCGFSHRIFKLAYCGPLEVILFSDLIVANGECEEARRCLARQCPLNRMSDCIAKKLLRARKGQKVELAALTRDRHCALFKEKPNQGGIILPPR